jgi:F-type H+-transporting ATPase subunit delta
MKDVIIAARYAEAFLGYAKGTIGLERAIEDFKGIRDVARENPGFLEILGTPEVLYKDKIDFIDMVLQEGFSLQFKQFLALLLEKERIDQLLNIAEYVRVTYSHGDEIEAVLKTTFPLDLELIKALEEKLEKKMHKKIKFYIQLDGSLLGGVQVIIGNTVLDGSVKRRLDELREKLMQIRIN